MGNLTVCALSTSHACNAEDKQHMQQELEARRQDMVAKERSLGQAEAAAEKRWAKLSEDVSAKVWAQPTSPAHCSAPPQLQSAASWLECAVCGCSGCLAADTIKCHCTDSSRPMHTLLPVLWC